MTTPATFVRTTCACVACTACCTQQPGPLAPGDMARIAAYLGKTTREILTYFWASPGALVENSVTRQYLIPTITPRMRDGRCIFLTDQDRCRIHEVAPFGCAYADTHQSEAEWLPKALWLYRTIEADRDYTRSRRTAT